MPTALKGALVTVLGAIVVLAAVTTRSPAARTQPAAEFGLKEQMIVQPPKDQCSKRWTGRPEDDCAETKCCQTSGYSCYERKPGEYGCLEVCDPHKNWTCQMPDFIVPLSEVKSHSSLLSRLYCYSVYTKNTGRTKPSYELELIQQQYQKHVSIFACEHHNVFADADAMVGSGYPMTVVQGVDNEFHVIKRPKVGGWMNTGLFKQVWKRLGQDVRNTDVDWAVKVDADAVFVPHRLKGMLQGHPLTYAGIYIENCKEVMWGFFGNLEVFSKDAFQALVDNLDDCGKKIDWVKGTKWGPIGEDLFAQMCMDYHGVSKVQNFDVTTDGACPGTKKRWGEKNTKKWKPPCHLVGTPAIHPFKRPKDYFACLDATMVYN